MKKITEICGWLGMVLIHGATLPTTIMVLLGKSNALPPIDMVLMIWTGLFLFLVRSIAQKDVLYTVSNGVGFAFQSILLALIVFAN